MCPYCLSQQIHNHTAPIVQAMVDLEKLKANPWIVDAEGIRPGNGEGWIEEAQNRNRQIINEFTQLLATKLREERCEHD